MLTVYLDSQDYSVLSDAVLNPELVQIKHELLAHAQSGNVRFVFSGLVVCEAVPTGSHAVDYAIARGDLLTELSRRSALLYPADLFEKEVRALAERRALPRTAVVGVKDWFPSIEFEDPLPLSEMMRQRFEADPDVKSLPRQQRRAAERKMFKNGALRPTLDAAIRATASATYVDGILANWPMDRKNAEVFKRYALGEATRVEACEAMAESLRDPRWLMRWFTENPELALPLADIVRKPGRELGSQLRGLIAQAEELKSMPAGDTSKPNRWEELPISTKGDWQSRVDTQVVGIVRSVAAKCGIQLSEPITNREVSEFCPGIDATMRSMMSSVWDNVGGRRRTLPSDSQVPDAMHAMYAPYVDVFRADAYMAPHIQAQVKRHGTSVVQRLVQLPAEIERRLAVA